MFGTRFVRFEFRSKTSPSPTLRLVSWSFYSLSSTSLLWCVYVWVGRMINDDDDNDGDDSVQGRRLDSSLGG